MDINDFENLVAYSKISNQDGIVRFEPKVGREGLVNEVIEKNNLQNLSFAQLNELAKKFRPQMVARSEMREKKFNEFINMPSEDIAQLPLERKIEYMETIFHKLPAPDELKNLYSLHKDKLKVLFYNVQLPQEFWQKEEKEADRFVALVSDNQKITEGMKNWQNLTTDDKKEIISTTAKIIEYVYNTPLEIGYYTSDEYRKQNNLDAKVHVWAAYHDNKNGKIFFNTDRFDTSDNYYGVSVVFHEFMHSRQHGAKFDDPVINRLFACESYRIAAYERLHVDEQNAEYGDFYSLMPVEAHAHAMQKYVEDMISVKTGIEKTQEQVSKATEQLHNKSFARALQFRSHCR